MNTVQQFTDGRVSVSSPNGVYTDTAENFEHDFGVQLPPLPYGGAERIYDQERRHAINDAENNTIGGGPMPWPLGDQLISNVEIGLAAQNKRVMEK